MTDITSSVLENGLALTMAITLLVYLGADKIETSKRLKEADAKREADREDQETRYQDLLEKQTATMTMMAESNRNVAEALMCVKLTLENTNNTLIKHDERSIGIDKNVNELCIKLDSKPRKK